MRRLDRSQAANEIHDLPRKQNGKARDSLFLTAVEGTLSPGGCEHSPKPGEQRMGEERVIWF
jgi:hypothetical protein